MASVRVLLERVLDWNDGVVGRTRSQLTDENATTTEDTRPLLGEGADATERTFPHGTYWMTRILLLRSLGLVYFFAFLTSAFQNRQLIGSNGLEPVSLGPRPTPFFSIFGLSDPQMQVCAFGGVLFSLWLACSVSLSLLLPLAAWLMYLSIVNLGSSFIMSYGWEWQILGMHLCICVSPPPHKRGPDSVGSGTGGGGGTGASCGPAIATG